MLPLFWPHKIDVYIFENFFLYLIIFTLLFLLILAQYSSHSELNLNLTFVLQQI